MKHIVLAFSGGLDTSFCTAYLTNKNVSVHTVTVNTGGLTSEELKIIANQSKAVGASSHTEIDAKENVYKDFISTLIRGNILRGNIYPMSVSAERTQQAIEVAKVAHDIKADAVAHGSTGAGNDQIRFDIAFAVLLPGIPIITPIRELGLTREKTAEFLTIAGLPVPETQYSINKGIWGTTFGGGWTHDPWEAYPEGTFFKPTRTLAKSIMDITITWDKGLPHALNNNPMNGPELIEALNVITQEWGIGYEVHLGDTALGIKGRIGFHAGAALMLIQAHRELEKLVLTHQQSFWKDHLANFWGNQLHIGQIFDPVMQDIQAMINSSQKNVIGITRIQLRPGHFHVTGIRSSYSLLDTKVAKYGEDNKLWTGEEARAFAKISAIPSLLAYKKGNHDY